MECVFCREKQRADCVLKCGHCCCLECFQITASLKFLRKTKDGEMEVECPECVGTVTRKSELAALSETSVVRYRDNDAGSVVLSRDNAQEMIRGREILDSVQHMLQGTHEESSDDIFDALRAQSREMFAEFHRVIDAEEERVLAEIEKANEELRETNQRKLATERLLGDAVTMFSRLATNACKFGHAEDVLERLDDFRQDVLETWRDLQVEHSFDVTSRWKATPFQNTVELKITEKAWRLQLDPHRSFFAGSIAGAGFEVPFTGGAVFDPVRRLAIETSPFKDDGRDLHITHLALSGSQSACEERKLVPFETATKPVYDGARYVYFQEHQRRGFGRLDLNTQTFERLADAPFVFCSMVSGFCWTGKPLFFSQEGAGYMYDPAAKQWSWTALELGKPSYRCCFMQHPNAERKAIRVALDGTVSEIDVRSMQTVKRYASRLDPAMTNINFDVCCAPNGMDSFCLFACGERADSKWQMFDATKDAWTETDWPTVGNFTKSAFFDTQKQQLVYHAFGNENWSAVQLY